MVKFVRKNISFTFLSCAVCGGDCNEEQQNSDLGLRSSGQALFFDTSFL